MDNVTMYAASYLYNKALADRDKYKLSLELLTSHASGIGDHSTEDYHKNLDESLNGLVDATDRINMLLELYPSLKND